MDGANLDPESREMPYGTLATANPYPPGGWCLNKITD